MGGVVNAIGIQCVVEARLISFSLPWETRKREKKREVGSTAEFFGRILCSAACVGVANNNTIFPPLISHVLSSVERVPNKHYTRPRFSFAFYHLSFFRFFYLLLSSTILCVFLLCANTPPMMMLSRNILWHFFALLSLTFLCIVQAERREQLWQESWCRRLSQW